MARLRKESKKYNAFLYWWDITPRLAEKLDKYDIVDFIKKDTGEICSVPIKKLKTFLTKGRQTTRGEGNWGIKVLIDNPNELAFEPGSKNQHWLYLHVAWKKAKKQ